MRLIDADEAIRRAKEPSIYDLVDTPEFLSYCPTVNLVGKWISVEDRLPNESGEYLTYRAQASSYQILMFSKHHGLWNAFDFMKSKHAEQNTIRGITHWMPLPEPPETPETEAANDGTV